MVPLCALLALFTAIVPFTRAFFRVEVDYNEGWNIYNADLVARHRFLYPADYGWTSVNYPMLSFWVAAQLHRFTHEYLFTARILSLLSLIACGLLVYAIVRSLDTSSRSSAIASLFCFALFCSHANLYVGMDDPQMFAQVFFLLGILTYLRGRRSLLAIGLSALVFVVAGCIKHNPIDFPLAVLVELAFVSLPLALWFGLIGLLCTAMAVWLNIHFGGPSFLHQLLAPRTYSVDHLLDQCMLVLGPVLIPLCIAIHTAWHVRKDEKRRIAAIFLVVSLCFGIGFSGGSGVSINALFSIFFAMSIILGIFLDRIANTPIGQRTRSPWTSYLPSFPAWAPLALFVWFAVPLILSGNWNPVAAIEQLAAGQRRFDQDVALLRSRPGPALCESLLECNFAAKPYVYDPFNATRLMHFHKLDRNEIMEQVQHHSFSVIQANDPFPREDEYNTERWDPALRAAIEANYVPAIDRRQPHRDDILDSVLYAPKPTPR